MVNTTRVIYNYFTRVVIIVTHVLEGTHILLCSHLQGVVVRSTHNILPQTEHGRVNGL